MNKIHHKEKTLIKEVPVIHHYKEILHHADHDSYEPTHHGEFSSSGIANDNYYGINRDETSFFVPKTGNIIGKDYPHYSSGNYYSSGGGGGSNGDFHSLQEINNEGSTTSAAMNENVYDTSSFGDFANINGYEYTGGKYDGFGGPHGKEYDWSGISAYGSTGMESYANGNFHVVSGMHGLDHNRNYINEYTYDR